MGTLLTIISIFGSSIVSTGQRMLWVSVDVLRKSIGLVREIREKKAHRSGRR